MSGPAVSKLAIAFALTAAVTTAHVLASKFGRSVGNPEAVDEARGIDRVSDAFEWDGARIAYTSTGGLTSGGQVQSSAAEGDYEVVVFGASHGTGQGKVDRYFDEAKMIGQGFRRIGVRGEEDRKVEMWVRRNGGQAAIDIPADARAYTFVTIDGKAFPLGLADIDVATVDRRGEPYEVPKAGRGDLSVLGYFSDDPAELTDVGTGVLLFQEWGFGDGDSLAVVLYPPGFEPPDTVDVINHEGGGGEYVGILATFTK